MTHAMRGKIEWSRRGMIAVFLFTSACFPEVDFDSSSSGTPDAGETDALTEVTVATFNVENFDLGGDAEGQYDRVAAFAAGYGVDILVLEEVQQDGSGDDETLFSEALAAAEYEMPYVGFSSMSDGFNALAVWSRYPLSGFEEILPANTRTAIRFEADVEKTVFHFVGCHLKSGDDAEAVALRLEEATRTAAYIDEAFDLSTDAVVLLGDMNTMTDTDFASSGTIDVLDLSFSGRGSLYPVNWNELPDAPTYPSTGSVLDHIFLSPLLREAYVEGSVAVLHPEGDGPCGPSDHCPVLVTLRL